jgi:hypothetical protein
MRLRPIIVAAATAAATAVSMAGPAQAAPTPTTLVQHLVGPLSLSVDHGHIYVSQSFAGKLTRYNVDGSGGTNLFVRNPDIDIEAVEARGPGTLFTVTGTTSGGQKFAQVLHLTNSGKKRTVANMRGFEVNNNPDHGKVYGFRDLSNSCAAKVPAQVGGKPYRGKVDSHPYGEARRHNGTILVADAGGNDLLRVTPGGTISVVAVLPAQPLKVTNANRSSVGLPKCTVGHKYYFEAVPTDVEVRGHFAYVTTLPGGPEDPSLGARGKVYRFNLSNGNRKRLGGHFLGATGVAVSTTGRVYVAELFGNRISTISNHKRKTVLSVPSPAAIEWHNGHIFATSNATSPNGSVIRFTP